MGQKYKSTCTTDSVCCVTESHFEIIKEVPR